MIAILGFEPSTMCIIMEKGIMYSIYLYCNELLLLIMCGVTNLCIMRNWCISGGALDCGLMEPFRTQFAPNITATHMTNNTILIETSALEFAHSCLILKKDRTDHKITQIHTLQLLNSFIAVCSILS